MRQLGGSRASASGGYRTSIIHASSPKPPNIYVYIHIDVQGDGDGHIHLNTEGSFYIYINKQMSATKTHAMV